MPGFSKPTQEILAILLRSHRRKFSSQEFPSLSKGRRNALRRLTVILRLAVLLHHNRDGEAIIEPEFSVNKAEIDLVFPEGYLDSHAMTERDLQSEQKILADAKFELRFK
jgi:exopolyphosphatase/guanosine-5'-triphosphate,3'-diphosphate pyrophosphatase